jgi:hypothetical protein
MEYLSKYGSNRRGNKKGLKAKRRDGSKTSTKKLGSMFKGVLSPVVGLAGLNALLFVSYGSILRYFQNQQPYQSEPSLLQVYLAGAGAGVACFFFSTPTDLIKIQAQMTKIPKTTLRVTKEIYAASGFRGFRCMNILLWMKLNILYLQVFIKVELLL